MHYPFEVKPRESCLTQLYVFSGGSQALWLWDGDLKWKSAGRRGTTFDLRYVVFTAGDAGAVVLHRR